MMKRVIRAMARHLAGAARLGACLWFPVMALAAVPDYQIRAVYLFNLPNFVGWPEAAFKGMSSFDYCIVHRGRVEKTLASLIEGEFREGRPVRLRQVAARPDDLRGCRVLYLRGIDLLERRDYLRVGASLPVLTVADDADFVRHGGMMALVRERRRIRMYINLARVRRQGLKMNARLLQLARIIDDVDLE